MSFLDDDPHRGPDICEWPKCNSYATEEVRTPTGIGFYCFFDSKKVKR